MCDFRLLLAQNFSPAIVPFPSQPCSSPVPVLSQSRPSLVPEKIYKGRESENTNKGK